MLYLSLSETFLEQGFESNFIINGYSIASAFSRANQRRDGTCIMVRNDLQFK